MFRNILMLGLLGMDTFWNIPGILLGGNKKLFYKLWGRKWSKCWFTIGLE